MDSLFCVSFLHLKLPYCLILTEILNQIEDQIIETNNDCSTNLYPVSLTCYFQSNSYPAGIYLFKINNGNTRKSVKILSNIFCLVYYFITQ